MKKKGMALPELAKLILAIMCIIVLLVIAVELYANFSGETLTKQAKANLDQIKAIIDNLQVGEEQIYNLMSPPGWFLVGFPDHGVTPELMPKECTKNNWKDCLCLCESENAVPSASCNDLGFCIEINAAAFYGNCVAWPSAINTISGLKNCKPVKDIPIGVSQNPYGYESNTPMVVDDLIKQGEHLVIKKEVAEEGNNYILYINVEGKGKG